MFVPYYPTESIAVRNKAFVRDTKEKFGIKAMGGSDRGSWIINSCDNPILKLFFRSQGHPNGIAIPEIMLDSLLCHVTIAANNLSYYLEGVF
jgi:hypothetical protein